MKLKMFEHLEVWESKHPIWKPRTTLTLEMNNVTLEDEFRGERVIRLAGKLSSVSWVRQWASNEELRLVRRRMYNGIFPSV